MTSVLVKPEEYGVKEEVLLLHEDDLNEIILTLGWKIRDNKVYDSQNKIIKCAICGETLTVRNLGAFFPGSIEAICSKFKCFIGEMAKIKAKIRSERK
jgi:hypothetical protein